MIKRLAQLLIITLVLNTNAQSAAPIYSSIVIRSVPHILQRTDFSGEASAAMFLNSLGENMDQDYVFDSAEIDPNLGRGLKANELARALRKIGFNIGKIWTPLITDDELRTQFAYLHEDLVSNTPSIVLMQSSSEDYRTYFRLVLGYDASSDSVIYHDPAMANGSYRHMALPEFLNLWAVQNHLTYGVVRIPLQAGEIEYGYRSEELTSADFAQHVMALRQKAPQGFSIQIEKPFVIISDALKTEVNNYRTRIVRQVIQLLKRDFFLNDPEKIIDIWMFKDNTSYMYHSRNIFKISPETPYGFYSPGHNALILDVSTGGGTIVHEMVHPFMNANFKDCPAWFNEGLASLFERPTRVDDQIKGLINWRLDGLKKKIASNETYSLEKLTNLSQREFYRDRSGNNYSQSKYLCYYLQEQGLLVDYYHRFYENRKTDPSGLNTLLETTGFQNEKLFQEHWQQWVQTL